MGKCASPCNVDLSSPEGSSVNDRIKPDEYIIYPPLNYGGSGDSLSFAIQQRGFNAQM